MTANGENAWADLLAAIPPEYAAAAARRAAAEWLDASAAEALPELIRRLEPAALADSQSVLARSLVRAAGQITPELARSLVDRWLESARWGADAEFRSASAQALLAAGLPQQALDCVAPVLAHDPRDAAALRVRGDARAALRDRAAAAADYATLLSADDSVATAAHVLRQLDAFAGESGFKPPAPLSTARAAVIGNVTLNYLASDLRRAALHEGLYLAAHVGGFDQFRQELLDGDSPVARFKPDAVVLVLDWRELLPDLYLANLASDPAVLRAAIESETAQLAEVLGAFRRRSSAAVMVTGPLRPASSPLGFLDAGHSRSVAGLFGYLNEQLAARLTAVAGVYVHDLEASFAVAGKAACLSAKMNYLGRMPYSPTGLAVLARDAASFVRQARGKARKCLVLDLDNTMWGGIIGEDGLQGIKLGHDGIGRAFVDFQREVLALQQQGVILAICSKNNERDALEVFEKHPDMVLKLEHFAAWRINWVDKPSNLKSLAEEINIGIDSLVFLDDNPVERGAVRQLVPEVLVPNLPRDPADYPAFVRGLTCFATLQMTEEDLKRGQFYAGERQRRVLQETAGNLDDYLQALNMTLHILPIDEFTRPRIVQLIHRTNQFNLTTRRHSEVDVLNMTPERGWYVFSIRLEDRYGDNGIVGVAILRIVESDPAFPGLRVGLLDTLLMSCRILGRNVERMFLAYLTEFAAARGAQMLIGEFAPSAKNAMVADFYPKFGFDPLPPIDGVQRWSFPCGERRLERPPYIAVRETP